MSKQVKIWLVAAASLVVLGSMIFAVAMTANCWDFSKLGTVKYETNCYEISEEFSNISINTDTADILFAASHDGTCKVVCYEQEKAKHAVAVRDGTLTINVVNEKEWYDHIGINFGTPSITVYLPRTVYYTLTVKGSTGDVWLSSELTLSRIDICASTGDICVENVQTGVLDLSVSTGKVTVSSVTCEGEIKITVSTGDVSLTNISCGSFFSSGDTGDISLKNVIVNEGLSVERSTGDVSFEKCDAAEVFVKTDTGDVRGTLLSEKVFIVNTDTGKIEVPNTSAGGRCEITTDTGDIKIAIKQ